MADTPDNLVSFVIPAHNEQALIGRTVRALSEAAQSIELSHEIIVVDDTSTDQTSEIASIAGAQVVKVSHRQIAATRNSGASAARGEFLIFVDADTVAGRNAIGGAVRAMQRGAVGGGALARLEKPVPLYAPLLMLLFRFYFRVIGVSGGAFLFCTRKAFDAVGGFDEKRYGGEDMAMSVALQQEGRFVVLRPLVTTSPRRVQNSSGLSVLGTLLVAPLLGRWAFRSRGKWTRLWYANRHPDQQHGLKRCWFSISNAIALAIVLVFALLPLWIVPWPQALRDSFLGDIRMVVGIFLSFVGLTLLPAAIFIGLAAIHQKRWAPRVKFLALAVVAAWLGWRSVLSVGWFLAKLGS